MAKKILALDIGASTVALAEYESAGKGALTLVNYGTATLAAPLDAGNTEALLSPAISEIIREKGIKPGPVALSVSGQMVFPKFAAVTPLGGEDKFQQMVRGEVEQNIPFPIVEMVWDYQVLGETDGGDKSVMIVAAKLDQIEAITSAVTVLGFSPEIVDVAPIALVNAVRASQAGSEGCTVVLDIGARTTSLVISEGEKLYLRSIPVAGNNITREIAQALGCSQEEAEQIKLEKAYVSAGGVTEDEDEISDRISKVCRAVLTRLHAEISRSINFYRSQQGGSVPNRLFLTGGTALLPQLDVFLAESLQLEVQYFNPFEFVGVAPAINGEALSTQGMQLGPTVGLALHAASASSLAINLIPPSILEARAEKRKIPVVIAAGLVLILASVLGWLSAAHRLSVEEQKAEGLQASTSSLESYNSKVRSCEKKIKEAKADADALRTVLRGRSSIVDQIRAVRSALTPGKGDSDMWIDKWESGHPTKVTIRGWADTLAALRQREGRTAAETVLRKLNNSSVVESGSARLSDSKQIGKTHSVEQFIVELEFK